MYPLLSSALWLERTIKNDDVEYFENQLVNIDEKPIRIKKVCTSA